MYIHICNHSVGEFVEILAPPELPFGGPVGFAPDSSIHQRVVLQIVRLIIKLTCQGALEPQASPDFQAARHIVIQGILQNKYCKYMKIIELVI